MTDTDLASAGDGSLSTMVLPELRALANQVGVKGTSGMRKGELIAAIQGTRSGNGGARSAAEGGRRRRSRSAATVRATARPAKGSRNGTRGKR